MQCIPPFSSLNEGIALDTMGDEPWIKIPFEGYKELIRKLLISVEVDEGWYRDQYPDVDQAIRDGLVKDAREHFISNGYFEGRMPSFLASSASAQEFTLKGPPVSGLTRVDSQKCTGSVQSKRDLVLHIGHGKTGSSFIQSVLVLNRANLERHGVVYPKHASDGMALAGKITSGNGDLILDPRFDLDGSKSYLFSNEDLFNKLLVPGALEHIARREGFKLRVVLYTRNVFEVLFSGWGQWVKRGGCTKDLDTFLAEDGSNLPFAKIPLWLDAAEEHGFDITVRNYSNHKADIAGIFLKDLLGADALDFEVLYPASATVNRSLTLAEYEIQRVFNKNIAGSSNFVSDVLVDGCPTVKASKLKCKAETYDIVSERIKPIVDIINSRIPVGEHIEIEEKCAVVTHESAQEYSISAEQIEVLVSSICGKINMSLVDGDANYLRDIAEKIKNGVPMGMEEALLLMSLAKRARPEGQYIGRKVEEWTSQLASQSHT